MTPTGPVLGEGLDGAGFDVYDPGAFATGGGGANAVDSGGAGGAGAGAGGFGGWDYGEDDDDARGSSPGGIDFAISERLTFGGGGGSGGENGGTAEPGGLGGGVVLLFSAELKGKGSVSANGQSVANGGPNGNAGGGAGGTVWLMADQASEFTGTVSARGGSGGHVEVGHGPGGGGGGGRVLLSTSISNALQSLTPPDVHGGAAGEASMDGTNEGPRGATGGGVGTVQTPIGSLAFP